ncbi:hypothetical protein BGZ95_001074 [Linnemannia exigua]|uniref:Secreted protein n=1 Tax=Linnemannia exigua TaxID=604196 RepID=A0AAD4DKP0_9FUNG|nr:hypothetical protein BGZ95_001074 [Linnemannia exigua]
MMFKTLLASATIALVVILSTVSAAIPGKTGALISTTEYCIFLPHKFGGEISDDMDKARVFCNKPIPSAPMAKILPAGFIKSIHLTRNTAAGWVQITGRIDRRKYGLKSWDDGGQYDIKHPNGGSYDGYKYFVEFVEPNENIYCLRACKHKQNCPTNKPTRGCKEVIGGNYS